MNALQLAEGYKYLYRHVNRLSFTMDLAFEAVRHNARWEERRARNRLDINAMSESDCKKKLRRRHLLTESISSILPTTLH